MAQAKLVQFPENQPVKKRHTPTFRLNSRPVLNFPKLQKITPASTSDQVSETEEPDLTPGGDLFFS